MNDPETTSELTLQAAPFGWREARLDLLLAEELAVNPEFAERFARAALEKAGHSPPPGPPALVHVRFNVWHEIDDGNHGENDLDATLTWRDGTTCRMLIEDKVWAPLQPRQAERYLARAQDCKGAAVICEIHVLADYGSESRRIKSEISSPAPSLGSRRLCRTGCR